MSHANNNIAEPKVESEQFIIDCKGDKNENNTILFRKYLHDIKNMKTLNREMINNIKNMSDKEKMDIIITFNDIVKYLTDYLSEFIE